MKKTSTLAFIIVLVLINLFPNCNKPEDNWVFCDGCGIDAWVGNFTGSGSYYEGAAGEIVDGVDVQLDIENPSDNQFFITILSPDYYSQSFHSSKTDSNYYFNIASESSSIALSLYQKGSEHKITGVAKKYHWEWEYEPDTIRVMVPDHTLSFEVFTQSQ